MWICSIHEYSIEIKLAKQYCFTDLYSVFSCCSMWNPDWAVSSIILGSVSSRFSGISPCSPPKDFRGENVGSSPNSGWIPSLALFSQDVFLKHSILTFLSLKKRVYRECTKNKCAFKTSFEVVVQNAFNPARGIWLRHWGSGGRGGGCRHGVWSYIKQVVNSVFKIIIVNCWSTVD